MSLAKKLNAAHAALKAGQPAVAERACREVLKADRGNAPATHLLGVIAFKAEQLPQALDWFTRAIALDGQVADTHYNQGLVRQRLGDAERAAISYRRALELAPDYHSAALNLGNLHHACGETEPAIVWYRKALALKTDDSDALYNLANTLREAGRAEEAIPLYERALRLNPRFSETRNNLGLALADLGRLDQAIERFEQALRLMPDFPDALNNLGNVLLAQGRFQAAAIRFVRALDLDQGFIDARISLGITRYSLGDAAGAAELFRQVVCLAPGEVKGHYNLGNVLRDQGRIEAAVDCYRRVLALCPDYGAVLNNLGLACLALNRTDEAEALFQRVLTINPADAEAANNLGVTAQARGAVGEALNHFRRAQRLDPSFAQAQASEGMVHLLRGDFTVGWPLYQFRLKRRYNSAGTDGGVAGGVGRNWQGESLKDRTIVLYAEQGAGDTLQFIRYARPLKNLGAARVVFSGPPNLTSLLDGAPGLDWVVNPEDTAAQGDFHLPLLCCPRLLGTTLATIPAEVPYLFPQSERVSTWAARLAELPGLKVGLVWRGNPHFRNDRQRSIAAALLAPLAGVPGVTLVGLQKNAQEGELETLTATGSFLDLGGVLGDFADTAAVLAGLDLVISVDTAVAHLAGALARPVWLLLPFAPDWRWLLEREDSPWYPTARLFRQRQPGDWPAVIERVRQSLISH
ncbi:Glycosyl transferase family 9 [uncultured Gammaproteobacteria bacterium]